MSLIPAVDSSLEKYFWRWAGLLLALLLACSIAADLRDKMWADELFTLYIAKQADIIKAITEGCDNAPPLYAMLVRLILPAVGNEALAVRLPATLGFCCMFVCLLEFSRRRMPAALSFVTSLLACNALLAYSSMGRGYGILLGASAGALLSWQSAAEGRRRGLSIASFAFCLAVMIAMHYYAIFFLGPLFLAELVRARASGKLDVGILAAMAPALLVLGIHYPLIAAASEFQLHFWSPAKPAAILSVYNHPFTCLFLSIYLIALVLRDISPNSAQLRSGSAQQRTPLHEWIALGALTATPPFVVLVSMFTTHIFVERYVPWSVIGFALLMGMLLHKAVGRQASIAVLLLAALMTLVAEREIVPLFRMPALRDGGKISRALAEVPAGSEPIVIPSAHAFMELSYYAEPRLRERLLYPASRELDLRYRGYDTDPLILVPLSRRTTLNVVDYQALIAQHPRFLFSSSSGDYLLNLLLSSGYRVIPIDSGTAQPALFEAEAPKIQ